VTVNVSQFQGANGNITWVELFSSSLVIIADGTPGTRMTVVIPGASFTDIAGNPGQHNVIVEADVGRVASVSSYILRGVVSGIAPITAGVSVGATVATGALSALGAAASAQGMAAKSNLMRSGFHFQVMSMSASLAVPTVPGDAVPSVVLPEQHPLHDTNICKYDLAETYRSLVEKLGWSTLNVEVSGLTQFAQRATSQGSRRLMVAPASVGLHKDTVYLLKIAAVSFSILISAHVCIIVFWVGLVKKPLPSLLNFPCMETMFAGYALVALSFYAAIPLGPEAPTGDKSHGGVAIHIALCLPYTAFLVWLAWQRTATGALVRNNRTPQFGQEEVRQVSIT
jgi:hypothetical protein